MGENIIFKSKFNLELFKTLVGNFAHIHSKSRKLGMFIFFPKMSICLSKQSKFATKRIYFIFFLVT